METREMNFFDLCRVIGQGIGKGCKFLISTFGKAIQLSFRHWIVVLIVLLLSGLAGWYYSRPSNRIYPVVGIVQLNGVTPFAVSQTYNALGTANGKFTEQNLPTMLGVDPIVALKNYNFKAHDLIDMMADSTIDAIDWKDNITRKDSNMLHVDDMVALTFYTKRPADVPVLQEAIIRYLNNQPSFQASYQSYAQTQHRVVRFHREQVEKLDSLTTRFYFDSKYESQVTLNHNNVVVGERAIRLFTWEIEKELMLLQKNQTREAVCTAPVVLVNTFTIMAPKNYPTKILFIALVLGWLMALLVAWLVENHKAVVTWLHQ